MHALVYTLALWGCAFLVIFPGYLLISLDDLSDLIWASLAAAAPAMWYSPAVVLLAAGTPVATALALLLIANTTRLLVSRGVPRKLSQPEGVSATPGGRGIFGAATAVQRRLGTSGVFGALAFQSGVCALWAGYPLAAAGTFVAGAAIWTRSFIRKSEYRPRKHRTVLYSALSIVVTLILTTSITATQFAKDAGSEAGLWPETKRIFERISYAPPKPVSRTPERAVTRLVDPGTRLTPVKDGVPGVILQPDAKPRRLIVIRLPGRLRLVLSHPMTFPFTGEYHLFPTSSGGVQPDSVVHKGTPLEFAYMTLSGGPVETEAYQVFDPPLDFAGCAKVLLTISSGEVTPSSVSMQLISNGRMEDLGLGIFGLTPAAREMVEFEVPRVPRPLVNAIRMTFQRNPAERYQNTRVAVEEFTLVPRTL